MLRYRKDTANVGADSILVHSKGVIVPNKKDSRICLYRRTPPIRWFLTAAFMASSIYLWLSTNLLQGQPAIIDHPDHPITEYHSNYHSELGAVVFLAPPRNAGSIWGIDRFCMLLRAVRSVDQHVNSRFGPYPIYILVAQDYTEYSQQLLQYKNHTTKQEGPYTERDRELIRQWAPNSPIHFVDFNMYTHEALEPNTTFPQIFAWRQGEDGGVAGASLGYASMCRLWSGRLQQMRFLDKFEFYLRMDDDSLLTEDLRVDPFHVMKSHNLTYAYRSEAVDTWGIQELWDVSRPHLDLERNALPFVYDVGDGEILYDGMQPYNNFHVSRVSFWRSSKWQALWKSFNEHHLFFKYRVGDANVHAIAVMMMEDDDYERWHDLPYVHNSNDYGPTWGTKAWVDECQESYQKALVG